MHLVINQVVQATCTCNQQLQDVKRITSTTIKQFKLTRFWQITQFKCSLINASEAPSNTGVAIVVDRHVGS